MQTNLVEIVLLDLLRLKFDFTKKVPKHIKSWKLQQI